MIETSRQFLRHRSAWLRRVVGIMTAIAAVRLTAFTSQMLIVRTFGVGADVDAFQATMFVPDVLVMVFRGTVAVLFVPAYVGALVRHDPEAADRVFSSVLNLTLLVLGALVGGAIMAAPLVVRATAPGFDAERYGIAVSLAGLIYPIAVAQIAAEVFTSALDGRKLFVISQVSGIALPATTIFALLFADANSGIVLLAASTLAGIALQTGILVLAVRAAGIRYHLLLDLSIPELRSAFRELPPVIVSQVLIHGMLFVDQIVASTLPAGDLTSLNYAKRILLFPVGMIFQAFSKTSLPYLSEYVAQQDWAGLRAATRLATWSMMVLCLLMTVGALVLSRPVISILFEGGRFTAEDTDRIVPILVMAALGLAPMGLGFVIPRVFNALHRNNILMWITVFSVVTNAVLDLALAPYMGAAGITLATTLVNTGAILLQLVALTRVRHGFNALGLPSGLHAQLLRGVHHRMS